MVGDVMDVVHGEDEESVGLEMLRWAWRMPETLLACRIFEISSSNSFLEAPILLFLLSSKSWLVPEGEDVDTLAEVVLRAIGCWNGTDDPSNVARRAETSDLTGLVEGD
jgi:hypothetical protein